ncbi:hypothetical protein [Laceyella putida]|uniref:Uncharacterized protein n=1 Tax=Laceyella putida TaxID=110101 RepID=A0ABW2RQ79_9BACL
MEGWFLERKWMVYYVMLIAIFLAGRWGMLAWLGFSLTAASAWQRTLYVGWVHLFTLCFLVPPFVWLARKWLSLAKTRVRSVALRIFAQFYSLIFLLFLFVVAYYSFLLSF